MENRSIYTYDALPLHVIRKHTKQYFEQKDYRMLSKIGPLVRLSKESIPISRCSAAYVRHIPISRKESFRFSSSVIGKFNIDLYRKMFIQCIEGK